MKQTENELQKAIIDYLTLKKYYVIRLNSGMMRGEYKGKTWVTKLAKKGTPDLMAFKLTDIFNLRTQQIEGEGVDLLFIEVKLPGKYATEDQNREMDEIRKHGARCFVIHSLAELQEIL